MNGKETISCPSCKSREISKTGKRENKNLVVQRYLCKKCLKTFSLSPVKNKTYLPKIILNTLSFYNLGYTQKEVIKLIGKTFKMKVPQKTISNWINQYKPVCTFARLRNKAIKLKNPETNKQYNPKNIIQKQTLNHIQPYTFKYHKAKLNLLTKEYPQFAKLKDYFEKINSKEFPHHIFTYNKENKNNQRASQIKFHHLKVNKIKKQNLANKLTNLALNLSKTNKERHQIIQDFFLTNDSTTIAAELPVYLTNWDAGYYRNQRNFEFHLNNYQTPITGHIDLLQIRNNLIHILDYKPDAHLNQEQTTQQLTIYALALSRKLNLKLSHFKAGWFDEHNYYEFYPLHAVYEKAKQRINQRNFAAAKAMA